MARKKMIEVKCDRCKRVHYIEEKLDKTIKASLNLEFKPSTGGTHDHIKLEFEDLCEPCERTIKNLVENIAKEIKGKSPDRKSGAKEEGAEDGPSIEIETTQPSAAGVPS